ncbi:hypothetical protein QCN27_17300 [Cereibacter sp. SYSU M97828]|nr:hypothetical protein [Cereibacter flavus]
MIRALACAAALAAAPLAVSAATVNPGDVGSETKLLLPGVTAFEFTPTAETNFSFTITASGLTSDLSKVSFGYSSTAGEYTFDQILPIAPGLSFGVSMLEGLTADAPFTLYFFANGTLAAPVVTVAYSTDEAIPAPIPVPAAGGMLMLALAGLGGAAAVRRRK